MTQPAIHPLSHHAPRLKTMKTALLKAIAVAATATALLAAPLVPASAAPGNGNAWGQSMQVASRAIPNAKRPNAWDSEAVWGTLRPQGNGPASASARVENSCAGCTGVATTLQVLTSGVAPAVTANNAATGYTTGDWAVSAAISVQVIMASNARSVTANNLASSVNVGCTGCITVTSATQYIVAGLPQGQLPSAARAAVLQIEQQLGLDLNALAAVSQPARTARAHAAVAAAAERGRSVIAAATGAAVEARVQVDTGD